MKLTIFLLVITISLASCESFNFMNDTNPRKKGFIYYNSKFQLDASTALKINKKYCCQDSGSVNILIFYADGFLNNHLTNTIDGFSTNRHEGGVIMGYFKIVKDSIFFTTKSFYQKRPTTFRGKINAKGDTLYFSIKYPTLKKPILKNYTLY